MSAAIWNHNGVAPADVGSDRCFDHHIVSLQLAPNRAEVFKDGAHAFSKVLAPGTVQIMRAGVVPRAVQSGRWRLLHLYVPLLMTDRLAVEAGYDRIEIIDPEGRADAAIERIGREVVSEMQADAPLSRLRIDVLGQELAIHLVRAHSNVAGTMTTSSGPDRRATGDRRIRRVIDLIDARLVDDLPLSELALAAGVSTTHLTKLFRAATGEPPHRWVMRRRFECACDMLSDPRRSITEVAHLCGFASSQHLATIFQRRLGTTPSAYRRQRLL